MVWRRARQLADEISLGNGAGPASASAAVADGVYAMPLTVSNVDDCYFYHTMDIPGHGTVHGEWDLRGREYQYLGGFDFSGKRVLELGAASGALTMYMEAQGAEVVAYDLSPDFSWDVVPFAGLDLAQFDVQRRDHLRRLNNGFWLNHAAHESSAKLMHGSIYDVPSPIGAVDVATFASILLHVREPFRALQSALRLVENTVIVTDVFPGTDQHLILDQLDGPDPEGTQTFELPATAFGEPKTTFMPQHWDRAYADTWWHLTPAAIQRFIGVLGFEDTTVTYHFATPKGSRRTLLYTVVGRRTKR